jgi:hypothetical protein
VVPGMCGQVIYHLLAAAHATRAPWPAVMLVSCMPLVTRTAEASCFGERRPPGRGRHGGAAGFARAAGGRVSTAA